MPRGTVFISYSSKDHEYVEALRRHAKRLEECGLVTLWMDREVLPGSPWADEIRRELETARLVLALVSPDFLASPWCISELTRAFELRDRILIDVVPLILRQCAWRTSPLGAIQALPPGGAPLDTFPNSDAAWADIVNSLERTLRGERVRPALPTRHEFTIECAEILEAEGRLMLLSPWRNGLEELAQDTARRTHGEAVTTLRLPSVESMADVDFYAEVSADTSVTTAPLFRQWLKRRSTRARPGGGHLVVLPYFGGPRRLVKELGHVLRGVFDELGAISLLVLGRASCASLLNEVEDFSLFSGIVAKQVPELSRDETEAILQRLGASPTEAERVRHETGGHPEWTALAAPEVRAGRLDGLARYLADIKLFGVLRDRLLRDRDRRRESHAGTTLEKLLEKRSVVRLADARNDFSFPEVRLYYDGVLVERDGRTELRCEAVRLAAERALAIWRSEA
jgi:hypothetical protein